MGHWYLPLSLCLHVLSKNIDSPPQYGEIIEIRHCKIGENVTLSFSSAIDRINRKERCDDLEWETLAKYHGSLEYNFVCETACYILYFVGYSKERKYNFTAIAENVTQVEPTVEPTVDFNGLQWGSLIVEIVIKLAIWLGIAAVIFVIYLVWKNKQYKTVARRDTAISYNASTEDIALKKDGKDVEESDYAHAEESDYVVHAEVQD